MDIHWYALQTLSRTMVISRTPTLSKLQLKAVDIQGEARNV